MHDPGFLAAHTNTVELQLLVTGVTYRYPGLLAKIVSTLDVLSGGRAMLGIGAAWYEREHAALGVPFPPLRERFERLEETLQIVHQMWSEDDGPYHGLHYRLAETINSPQPLRVPRPPIMVGGGGEKKTLRLVAQYADPATCSPVARAPGPTRSARSSRSSERTARGWAPTSTPSASRSCGPVRWRSQPPAVRRSPRHSGRTPKSASTRFT
ncbi:LLM class flavin-dependent oxidoreductase [Kribbella sp. NBC_01484]|uniref:LLM class flavin-dependent oxidoreductase n=1 Tax=Kribbella sp. NBC_01484 TaxID=2903579 RepID=UPI003FA5633F